MASATIDVVVKVTERCNLACPYCYFFFGGDESHALHPPLIPQSTVDGLVNYLAKAQGSLDLANIRLILHGGEPLLLKKKKFREICQQIHDELDALCNFKIVMQTNGVLLDSEWIDIFEEQRVSVGVSMDGDPIAHNRTRITKKGRGTYDETRRGWELLKQAAALNRIEEPGLICVINPDNDGTAAYEHFAKEMRATSFNFLLPDLNHDHGTLPDDYFLACSKYMTDVFLAWARHGDAGINVRFITEALYPMVSDEALKELAQNSSQARSLISVSSNGEITPNDVLRGLSPEFRRQDITLFNSDLNQAFASGPWQTLAYAESNLSAACMQCEWRNVCRGGSLQHRYSKTNGFDNPSVFCSALKRYYATLASSAIRAGNDIDSIEHRLGLAWNEH